MLIYKSIDSFASNPDKPLVLALGNFDGLHQGHQALVKETIQAAKKINGFAGVFTFRKHPQSVLHPETKPSILTSAEYKAFLLEKLGIDLCFMIPFTQKFSEIEAESFVRDILVQKLKVYQVGMGYNARFGFNRKGDIELMAKLAKELSFVFEKVEPVTDSGQVISSSRIRGLAAEANLEEASSCLGRRFSALGQVIRGDQRGRDIGFPTANLNLFGDMLLPEGVYAVKARIVKMHKSGQDEDPENWHFEAEEKWREAVLNYGRRPTFTGGAPLVEVHILDFDSEIYGECLEIDFYHRLRPEKDFGNPEALKTQIKRDIDQAKELFRSQAS